jgi:hypothetical protein
MTVPVKMPAQGDIMESVIAKGDLAKLTPDERVRYYNEVCRSMGLNPLTQPFSYITLNGKLTLYATRACADQLRKVNGVSLEIVSREIADDVLTVHVRAKLPDGRVDEDLGSVSFPASLKGEARANAELKGVTKAKRRATLSICGLGWLDETEIADIPANAKRPAPAARNVMLPAHDAETGEIVESTASSAASAAPPVDQPLQDGVADVSTADQYIDRWEAIVNGATNGDQLKAKWNDEADERKQIAWGEGEFITLQKRVKKAIEFLKAPAA